MASGETYGEGAPLLLVHGNGGSIVGQRCQIRFFSQSRRVVVADSRGHGKSEDGTGPLKYEQIADDLAALLPKLGIDRTDVLGHSDGGIVALLLAIRHPVRVSKVIASAPNLRPDSTAVFPWAISQTEERVRAADKMIAAKDSSRDWARFKRQQQLMLDEPHITAADLSRIASPTLVIGSDDDVIPLDHFVEIYKGIPNAHLFIMPGATHGMLRLEHELFNAVAARFLKRPFSRPTSREQRVVVPARP